LLNLREAVDAPRALARRVFALAHEDDHPLLRRPLRAVTIAQWLDTLYDLQDPLLLGSEEIEDTASHPQGNGAGAGSAIADAKKGEG
jgi:hypothetical protein